ncbi:rod shape-determining protein MreC, partial [Intrasporangium sp.]|uniref:rod shape-determining protein MreC n=1 Tax=Intrasporangium sp. TaxID=1925024 RepID=UPI00293B63F5
MSLRSKQRLLGILLVVTAGVLLADLAGHPAIGVVRSVSGAALGPVQRFLAGARPAEMAALSAENARLRARVDSLARQVEVLSEVRDLVGSGLATDHTVVIGQVVATELSPLGGRSVTVDVGARDGVVVDTTVVSRDGLVGRVVAVSPWTSDVQVLGADQSVVAVRVGERGLLGTVGPVPVGSGVGS